MVDLMPCPNVLCDLSRPFLNETDSDLEATHTWVYCENCGACGPRIANPSQYFARTHEWDAVKAEAIAAWNTRTPPATQADDAGLVDLLTKAIGDISAALTLGGNDKLIAKWTAPYAEAVNRADAVATNEGGTQADDALVEELARAVAVAHGVEICSDAQYRHSSFRKYTDAIERGQHGSKGDE